MSFKDKIHHNLIIFLSSEPEKFINELIINSIDSYNTILQKNIVGKWGIGFFSIFYWLFENPLRKVRIISECEIIICLIDNHLKVTTSDKYFDGTIIRLECENAILTDKNITKIFENIFSLSKDVSIIYNDKVISNNKNGKVNIIANKSLIQITDTAQGITKEKILNELLVPFITNKYNKDIKPSTIETSDDNISKLTININNIPYVTLTTYIKGGYTFTLNTLSKNTIISESLKLFKISIDLYNDVSVLLSLIEEYDEINKILYSYPQIIYVPLNYTIYTILQKYFSSVKFVTHLNPDMYITEKQIDNLLDRFSYKNIFKFKKVIFLPLDVLYETGGLSNYIFVKEFSITKEELIMLFQDAILIPSEIITSNSSIKDAIEVLRMTWDAKFQNINMGEPFFINNIIISYYNLFHNDVLSFINYINSKISKIHFDFSYGMNPNFHINKHVIFYLDNLRIKQGKSFLSDNTIKKLFHWYIDIWPLKTSGNYSIPPYTLLNAKQRFITSDEKFIEEIKEGLDISCNGIQILTFLNIMFINQDNQKGIGKYCMNEIKKYKELNNIGESALIGYSNKDKIIPRLVKPILQKLKDFSNKLFIEEYEDFKYTFTCNQTIDYLFHYNDFNIDNISLHKNKKNFKMVEFILSRINIYELFKVLQSFNPKNINISTDQEKFIIFSDIGIDNIWSLLVPFLSIDMLGFFTIYGISKRVIIDITFNNIKTIIEAIPLLNDIQYNLKTIPYISENIIKVIIFPKDEIILNYLFLYNNIYLNGKSIKPSYSLILSNNLGNVYLINDLSIESYILINNISFKSIKDISPNIYPQFINDGAYRIIFDFKNSFDLDAISFINDGLYLSILQMYNNDDIKLEDSIIMNSTSCANPEDLKFSKPLIIFDSLGKYVSKNIGDLYTSYLPLDSTKTLGERINTRDIKEDILSFSIKKWLSNKSIKYEISSSINKISGCYFKIFQPFIDLYWELTKDLIKEKILFCSLTTDAPQIIIGALPNHFNGYYDKLKHIIFLNGDLQQLNQIISQIKELYKSNPSEAIYLFRTNNYLTKLISPSLPLPILIHELLHAIQCDDHKNSSHGYTNILGYNISFDTCAHKIYSYILKKQIVIKFLNQ